MKNLSTPAYLLRAGEGQKQHVQGAEVSIIASREQTGELVEVVTVSAPSGFRLPAHLHTKTHKSLYVLAGELHLSFLDKTYHLKAGDFGHVPKGTAHVIQHVAVNTKVLYFSVAGGVTTVFTALAHQAKASETGFTFPESGELQLAPEFEPSPQIETVTNMKRPDGVQAYVIAKGGGEHLIVEDQLQTFLVRQNNTDGQFLVVLTDGPKGNAIIQHFHKLHTECFYCLEGEMTMWNEGQTVPLKPGDFLHVPAYTKHSYRLDSTYTKFIGVLSPGLFEPFFDALCTPYPENTMPQKPGPARFDRLLKNYGKLDLYFVSPPPDKTMNPIQANMVRLSFWLAGKLSSK